MKKNGGERERETGTGGEKARRSGTLPFFDFAASGVGVGVVPCQHKRVFICQFSWTHLGVGPRYHIIIWIYYYYYLNKKLIMILV